MRFKEWYVKLDALMTNERTKMYRAGEVDKQIERLRELVKQKNLALQEYGYHYPRCNKLEREANDCSCGFEQALKEE